MCYVLSLTLALRLVKHTLPSRGHEHAANMNVVSYDGGICRMVMMSAITRRHGDQVSVIRRFVGGLGLIYQQIMVVFEARN